MKKILSPLLLCISFLGFVMPVFSQSTKEEKVLGYNQYTTGDYSYSNNVANFCLGKRYGGDYWNFDTSKQLIIQHNKDIYPDLSKTGGGGFDNINKIYLGVQNRIMNCAILKSKYNLHKTLIQGPPKVSDKAKKVLEEANAIIEDQIKEQECIAPRDGDKIYNSKDLLDSLSYEQCVYSMYLFYYKKTCDTNLSICLAGKEPKRAVEFAETVGTEKAKLNNEFDISNRALETALSLYENFERTYIAHVMLQLIEVELIEYKRYIGVTMKAIQQWISLAKNVQRSSGSR